MNFKLINYRNYDEHHRYGTDWVSEYVCECDENIEIEKTLEELKKLGHNVYGEIRQYYDNETHELKLIAKMY